MMRRNIPVAAGGVNAAISERDMLRCMSIDPPRRPVARELVPLAILVLTGALFVALGGGRYLTFAALAAHSKWLLATVARAGALAAVGFILGYAVLVALWFPAAELLTITGGFLFGRWFGTLYAVVGATAGATVVFLAVRAGVSGLTARAGPGVAHLAENFRRDGFNYLLFLRLVPVFPFWLVNIVAGAAGLTLRAFVIGTLIGIIPGAFVYASLGAGLDAAIAAGRRPDVMLLFRPNILLPLLGLAVLSLLPVACRHWRRRRSGT
jgi:uncharacterized membrane protein YdjX (TVP38/TMEM64 family)